MAQTNSNGISNEISSDFCPFCKTRLPRAGRNVVTFIRLSKPSDQKTFHLFCGFSEVGLKISIEQKEYFDKITGCEKLDAFYLTDGQFNILNALIDNLLQARSEQKIARKNRSNLIFNEIIRLHNNRLSEDDIKEALQREYSEQVAGSSFPMAVAVA